MDAAQPLQNGAETPTVDHKGVVMSQLASELTKVEFGTFRSPERVMDEAKHVARVFQLQMETIKDPVTGDPILYRMFDKSRHITRPGWQLLGSMFRVTAGIVPGTSRFVELPGNITGYEATAEAIYVPTGARISTADGMCLNDEPNWDERPTRKDPHAIVPLFQLRSMAQTRACSKVLSNLLSYVAIMAGCSGTAAEEMTRDGMMNGAGETRQQAQQPQRAQNGNGLISDKQVNRLWAIASARKKSDEAVGVVLESFGYSTKDGIRAAADQIKRTDYDAIVAKVDVP